MRIALLLVVTVGVVLVLVRAFESKFAFFPTSGVTTTPRDYGVGYEPLTIETADGERLRAWLLPHPRPRAFVVYFHGNGGNLSMWAPILANIVRQRYAVMAIDYRGYGESSGAPGERGLYRDVEGAIAFVRDRINPGVPLVYWGRSLGVSMAAYAATRHRPAAVILESGFPDARSLLRGSPLAVLSLFSSYRFPAARLARDAKVPALVMHGDADRVIPFEQGRALFANLDEPREFYAIRGGDHNDAVPPDVDQYWRAVNSFIARHADVDLS